MEEVITSVKNNLIVKTKKIIDKFDGLLFLDNPKAIQEAYLANKKIEYVLVDIKKKDEIFKKFDFLKNEKIFFVTDRVIESLSQTKTPQGVVGVVKIENSDKTIINNNCLVLENLQDPGNLGTIIRSARGTNFKDIVLISCVSPYNQKVVRSTMGALFFENYHFFKTTEEFLDFSKKEKIDLVVADMDGENLFLAKKPTSKYGLVVGNEGNGVSKLMRDNCNKIVSIPMKNNLESLNVSVALGIMMYYFDNI